MEKLNLEAAFKVIDARYQCGDYVKAEALCDALRALCSEPAPTREPLKRWRKYYRAEDGTLRSWLRAVPIAAVLKPEDAECWSPPGRPRTRRWIRAGERGCMWGWMGSRFGR